MWRRGWSLARAHMHHIEMKSHLYQLHTIIRERYSATGILQVRLTKRSDFQMIACVSPALTQALACADKAHVGRTDWRLQRRRRGRRDVRQRQLLAARQLGAVNFRRVDG